MGSLLRPGGAPYSSREAPPACLEWGPHRVLFSPGYTWWAPEVAPRGISRWDPGPLKGTPIRAPLGPPKGRPGGPPKGWCFVCSVKQRLPTDREIMKEGNLSPYLPFFIFGFCLIKRQKQTENPK